MKVKRVLLIVVLLAFSFTCIHFMNDSYDRLARYQYEVSDDQRKIMEEHLSDDDISFIIQQKIKPELLMKYITLEDFKVKNTLYYEVCAEAQPMDLRNIIKFVNAYKSNFTYYELENLMLSYDYQTLSEFYEGAYNYFEDAKLVVSISPTLAKIKEEETLYKYRPDDIVDVDSFVVPTASIFTGESIQIRNEVIEPMKKLCEGIGATNNKTCGGLILTTGYVSYEKQVSVYEQAIVKYGFDNFKKYEDYPGQSLRQLGMTLTFIVSEIEENQYAQSEQAKWLMEHADEYGFEVLYPLDKEQDTKKEYQPFTLRYKGIKEVKKEVKETQD